MGKDLGKILEYTETLEQSVKRHEGLRLFPYLDAMDNSTVGWGRNLTSNGIRRNEAELMLQNDITDAIRDYDKLPASARDGCNSKRKDVIVEMIFQLGFTGVLKFKNMLKSIEQREFNLAGNHMIDSLWFRQTKRRCEELADRMKRG